MSIAQRTVWRIDIDKGSPAVRTKNDLYQGDSQANSFACELYRGDTPVTITGYTVTGAFDRSDGATVPCKGTAISNTAEVLLNEHCYRYSGPFTLSIQLTKGEESRTILQIAGTVQSSGEGPVVDTDEVLVDLDELLALVDETKAAAQAAAEAAEAANAARESITDALNMTANGIVIDDTTPESMVHIKDAAPRQAMELVTHIEREQDGSGWNKAIVQSAGKNLLPNSAKALTTNGITYTVNYDLSVTVNGTATGNAYLPFDDTTYLSAGTEIVLDSGSSKTEVGLQLYIKRDDGTIKVTVTSSGRPVAFTIPESITYMGYLKVAAGVTVDNATVYPSLRLKTETNTAYEPYNGQRLTADLPETVYGGTLNWTTGILYSTLSADGNDLAEPKVIQLTPKQLDMLQGVNNVWSNCGKTRIAYIADTKQYIDNKFAELAAAQLGV